MKSMKRIFAVILTVMMVALMVPFAANASTNGNTLTLKCDKSEFTFDVYKIADVDANGKVTVLATDTAVANAVKAAGTDEATVTLVTACDNASANALGTKLDSFDGADGQKVYDNAQGIYYIKPVPKGIFTRANSSIAVVNGSNEEVNLASKVATEASVLDKVISKVNDSTSPVKAEGMYASASVGDTITYTITTKAPGSDDANLTKFVVTDTMESSLDYVNNTVKVTVDGTEATNAVFNYSNHKFTVDFASYLSASNFYGKDIVITFDAKLNGTATTYDNTNDNTVKYTYSNATVTDKDVDGPTPQVFCFNLEVYKVDTSNTALGGAKFGLYSDSQATTPIKAADGSNLTGTSTADGIVDFFYADNTKIQLGAGKYYVKELSAPKGYVLDETVRAITISYNAQLSNGVYKLDSASSDVAKITVKNTEITVPKTGGMGTWMFTIGGASLIALAGVMFIVLKKRSSAK